VKLGVINLIRSSRESIEIAKAADAAGFWGMGLGDTVPRLYQDTYVTAGACFAATKTLNMGPTVTNTVARHWSVLGATARTFDELYPGRFFAGVATGDGALYSVGMAPASWSRLERDIAAAQELSRGTLRVHIAASGPRGCEAAGRIASDLIIGTGLDAEALRNLSARARAARVAAGITQPLRVWAFINTYVAPNEAAAKAATHASRGRANGRYAFASTFEDKAVPEKWHAILRERHARYDHSTHGVAGDANVNTTLFDDHPDLREYLSNRFQLFGTADQCAARLKSVAEEAGLDGAWLSLSALTPDEDAPARVRTTGEALRSLANVNAAHA
jgi:alkanesulfonate monooxygenase SsuD/methylene tetrahydromethanopterin reductase-like flavin-dependent oxidoreductase (luciferase family)